MITEKSISERVMEKLKEDNEIENLLIFLKDKNVVKATYPTFQEAVNDLIRRKIQKAISLTEQLVREDILKIIDDMEKKYDDSQHSTLWLTVKGILGELKSKLEAKR